MSDERKRDTPENEKAPGAIDYIEADPEAFDKRVKEFAYANAMNKLNLPEGDEIPT